MDTGKVYQDSAGNDCSIVQMVSREPYWAANRVQEGEKAIEQLATLKRQRDALLDALWLVLPMAKGYAAANRVGSNADKIRIAEAAIAEAEPAPEPKA